MDFDTFYRRAHDREPFPWQRRLAAGVSTGHWPDALTLPTSAGKTAVIDVWLWAHAQGIAGTPRRLYYLIDRRLLVDAAADYAAQAIAASGMAVPVARLRGGLSDANDEWMLDPSRPAFVSTTVDQLGSRLLCRAYGVGRYSAALHAGLAGNDALIVVDEAHLVEPLRQTLAAVGRLRRQAEQALHLPWHVLTMTATPLAGGEALGLEDEDRAHPVLARRLGAHKYSVLVKDAEDGTPTLVRQAVQQREAGAGVVGVVVNTVNVARAVFTALSRHGEAMLLIGRARGLDRHQLAQELLARCGTGTRSAGRAPLFVVATQTIEVGVDLDFDALVTELAPVSALRQRFGRLDRLGELGTSRATIVHCAEANLPYGKDALTAAARWLQQQTRSVKGVGKVIDFGILALGAPPEEQAKPAPALLPADIPLLFDASVAIDVTPYLHGEVRALDVQIAWRSALDEVEPDAWAALIEDLPPHPLELMPVPMYAVRAWLAGRGAPVGDIEGARLPEAVRGEPERERPVVVWDGEQAELRESGYFRPGEVLIAPASYGGCDRFGWSPASTEAVTDFLAEALLPPSRWTGDDTRTRRAIGLADHLRGVGELAQRFAAACALPDELAAAIAEAARLHDLGKGDPRYQLMLGAPLDTLLAKSGPHEVQVSRDLAGLPRGWRHEVASLAMRPEANDLVRYLVGAHHGRGRPWLPAAPDVALWRQAGGAQWPALAQRMMQRHGHWGLAYLEAIVRLADWVRSAEEQKEVGPEPAPVAA